MHAVVRRTWEKGAKELLDPRPHFLGSARGHPVLDIIGNFLAYIREF